MEKIRRQNVDVGTLVAFVIAAGAIIGAVIGVQRWVDNRIDHRVAPVEQRLTDIEGKIDDALEEAIRNRDEQFMRLMSEISKIRGYDER